MGALPKPEPQLAEVVEIDGRQMLRLPKDCNLKGKLFRVIEYGDSVHLNPPRKVFTPEDWKLWLEDMHRFQEELGDFMPDGRNQPPMPTQA